jgi:hypothetical protein
MMIKLHEIAQVLTGSFEVDTVQLDIEFPKIQEQADRIVSKGSRRSDDSVLLHCLEGTIAELGCLNAASAKYEYAELNPHAFNHRNPKTYTYDLACGDIDAPIYIEIKRLKSADDIEWLEFNYQDTKPGLSLTTYIDRGIDVTEFLVLASIAQSTAPGNEIVYYVNPKYVILSRAFRNYIEVNINGYFTHQVNLVHMVDNGHAIKVS